MITEGGVTRLHKPLLHDAQQSRNRCLGLLVGEPKFGKLATCSLSLPGRGPHIAFQQLREALRLQNDFGHFSDDDAIKHLHAHTQALAVVYALLQPPGAAIVAVSTRLAGVLDQDRAAVSTARDSFQQSRSIGYPRRHALWVSALKEPLHDIKDLFIHERGHLDSNPLGWRPWGTLSAIALVEVVEASIGARTQDDVNAACRPAVSDGSAPETNWVT